MSHPSESSAFFFSLIRRSKSAAEEPPPPPPPPFIIKHAKQFLSYTLMFDCYKKRTAWKLFYFLSAAHLILASAAFSSLSSLSSSSSCGVSCLALLLNWPKFPYVDNFNTFSRHFFKLHMYRLGRRRRRHPYSGVSPRVHRRVGTVEAVAGPAREVEILFFLNSWSILFLHFFLEQ